jgi:glutamate carboxypeptidase
MHDAPRTTDLQRLHAAVEGLLPRYLVDLETLVNIDSGSYTKPGVDEVGEWMAQRLERLGASVVRHRSEDLGDTFVATLHGMDDGPTVLLIGHTDTVFEEGTVEERPYHLSDRIALGPGVSDMKSGLLAGLYALEALHTLVPSGEGWLPVRRVSYVVNPDEEIGSPASTPVIESMATDADVALVLEAARENGDIVSARKGMIHFRASLSGRAAHAGVEPEKGRSAVLEAAHKTVALHALNGRWDGVTVNVGTLDGGTRPNIVAERAVMSIDLRARTKAEQQQAEAAIRAILEASTVPDVQTVIEVTAQHWPMEKTEAAARLVDHAVEIAASLGFELRDAATGGGSDANTTAGLGVPSLDGLGPVGGNDHSPAEYIELDSIVPRITLLAGLLVAIGGDAGQRRRSVTAPPRLA